MVWFSADSCLSLAGDLSTNLEALSLGLVLGGRKD